MISNYKVFIRSLLKKMLIFSPYSRPSADIILQSRDFMDNFVNGAINNRNNQFAATFLDLTVYARGIFLN